MNTAFMLVQIVVDIYIIALLITVAKNQRTIGRAMRNNIRAAIDEIKEGARR